MKRFPLTVAAALVTAAFSTAALAQDKPTAPANSPNAGKTQQAPKQGDVQREEPKPENMDSNAQRQHSRSAPGAAPSNQSNQGSRTQQAQAPGEVRNWGAIDKNKDHLISAEEMEAELQKGKSASKQ